MPTVWPVVSACLRSATQHAVVLPDAGIHTTQRPRRCDTCTCICCRVGSGSEDETSVTQHAQLSRLVSAAVVRMSLPDGKAALPGDHAGVWVSTPAHRLNVARTGAGALLNRPWLCAVSCQRPNATVADAGSPSDGSPASAGAFPSLFAFGGSPATGAGSLPAGLRVSPSR